MISQAKGNQVVSTSGTVLCIDTNHFIKRCAENDSGVPQARFYQEAISIWERGIDPSYVHGCFYLTSDSAAQFVALWT